ncbi:MAG: sensor histidine kinase, partial [Verrucomicrobiota bacterium]
MNPQRSPTIVLAFAAALSWLAETHAELKTAREVRLLTAEQADQAKPVEVEGIVIFSDPPSTAFLQDESAGTFFRLEGKPAPKPGDRVRVRGRTFPGLYLSGIEETEFEVLGFEGLPEAIPVAFDDLMSGRFHYQRVSVEGVVRALRPDAEGASVLELALGTRVLLVEIYSPMNQATGWTDRFIRVTGLAAGRINSRRQLVTPYLRCRDWNDLEVLREASMPGTIPRLSAHELLAFSADGSDGHRVRLEGTVLARIGRSIFLRDEEAAVEVVPAE